MHYGNASAAGPTTLATLPPSFERAMAAMCGPCPGNAPLVSVVAVSRREVDGAAWAGASGALPDHAPPKWPVSTASHDDDQLQFCRRQPGTAVELPSCCNQRGCVARDVAGNADRLVLPIYLSVPEQDAWLAGASAPVADNRACLLCIRTEARAGQLLRQALGEDASDLPAPPFINLVDEPGGYHLAATVGHVAVRAADLRVVADPVTHETRVAQGSMVYGAPKNGQAAARSSC